MKRDRNLGILLSTVSFLAGAYLLYASSAISNSYADFYVLGGAALSAIGLIIGSWAVRRHLFIKKLEQHVRGD